MNKLNATTIYEFYIDPVEDAAASIEAGRPVYRDREMVRFIKRGADAATPEIVTMRVANIRPKTKRHGNDSWTAGDPALWAQIQGPYDAWRSGQEAPLSGTPLSAVTFVSPGPLKTLQAMHIRTVEELAEANEDMLAAIGMGGRALKQQAIDYLREASSSGTVLAELAEMRRIMDEMREHQQRLIEERDAAEARAAEAEAIARAAMTDTDGEAAPAAPPAKRARG